MTRINITYKPSRIVIFGDLHANWEALLTLQQSEIQPLAVLCLGDIIGYGPDPKRCLDAVRASGTHLIGGWHDHAVGRPALASNVTNSPNSDGYELLEATWGHTRSVLSAADRAYLSFLPTEITVEIANTRFHLTRFLPDDLNAETQMLITMPQAVLQERFGQIEADVILLGGPHVPAMRQLNDRLIICPGSLGQPRYGIPEPTFAVWHNGRAQIHHLHYEPHVTARKLSLLPLAPEHRLHLQSVLQSGGID
jgi:predicted phosphodiesterase